MKRRVLGVLIILVGLFSLATGTIILSPSPKPWNIGIWFLRTDSQGDTLWTRIYCEEDQYPYNPTFARQTSDGGYIITGGFFDDEIHDFYGKKFWLIKISKTGWMKWCEIYDVSPNDSLLNSWVLPSYVTETPNRGYLIESSWRPEMSHATPPVWFQAPPVWFIEVDSVGNIVSFNDKSVLTAPLTKGDPFFSKYNPSAKVEYLDYLGFFHGMGRKEMFILEEEAFVSVTDSRLRITADSQRQAGINLVKTKSNDTLWSRHYSLDEYVYGHFVGLTPDKGFIILAEVSFPRE